MLCVVYICTYALTHEVASTTEGHSLKDFDDMLASNPHNWHTQCTNFQGIGTLYIGTILLYIGQLCILLHVNSYVHVVVYSLPVILLLKSTCIVFHH